MSEGPVNPPEVRHVESVSHSEAGDNPVRGSLDIVVSVPDSIQIRMVDASILADYEVWFFLASVLSSAVIGFLVAAIQALDVKAANTVQLFCTCLVFFVLFITATIMAFRKRQTLTKRGKDVKMKATEIAGIKR